MITRGPQVNVLTYHVVSGEARAASLCNGQRLETLQGEDVGVTILGSRVFIDESEVTAADVLASNGVVHVIDAVLLPADELAKLSAQVAAAAGGKAGGRGARKLMADDYLL